MRTLVVVPIHTGTRRLCTSDPRAHSSDDVGHRTWEAFLISDYPPVRTMRKLLTERVSQHWGSAVLTNWCHRYRRRGYRAISVGAAACVSVVKICFGEGHEGVSLRRHIGRYLSGPVSVLI